MMLGVKSDKKGHQAGATTLIAKGTELRGDIRFTGNLEIEGIIKGNIIADENSVSSIRVMDKGRVEGHIQVPNIIINGDVTGDIHSSRHIELAAKANVMGNVYYHTIEMVKGAHINGNLVFQQANVIKLEAVESRI